MSQRHLRVPGPHAKPWAQHLRRGHSRARSWAAGESKPFEVECAQVFWMYSAASGVLHAVSPVFRAVGVAPSHGFVLMALADAMTLDRSTVTRLIQRLEQQRLVKRAREGRNTWMSIQPAGLRLIPAIHEAWHDLYRRYSDEFGESQAETVNRQIAKVIQGGNR